ncbi:PREDICTED: transcription factor ORG2 isoform X2 [Theobroma cacao]|uniref:Transcription factor ORG2 isoform X2 n=2 Tax=Theobroma cacao TaxID=3641 RepID=A0AB32V4C8_THECC|nr:PREDICTED: transcription factor ORG2 isoform X2 [Theobroma cacao]EOY08979.1 Basic helix-loop-helix DNA-binding superfamily protein, putative isoform 2 [Theobroma cacao]
MCALTPFPVCEWPLDSPINHIEQISYTEIFEDLLRFTSTLPPIQLDRSPSCSGDSGNNPIVLKKLNHNARERDRRKKINSLYTSLRSLLPLSEQTRLSIPATISRVLKYIPELQAHVERLVQKKEEILSRQEEFSCDQENKRKGSSSFAISVSRVSEREVVVQISTFRAFETPLSHVLFNLEEDGLFLTEASCFESFGGRVFYNLHFQVERTYNLEGVVLNEKLLSLYEKRK